jgi:formiminotetrahydrofolate cyclodeaminase
MENHQQMIRNSAMEKRQYENQVQEHVATINQELTQIRNELSNTRKFQTRFK